MCFLGVWFIRLDLTQAVLTCKLTFLGFINTFDLNSKFFEGLFYRLAFSFSHKAVVNVHSNDLILVQSTIQQSRTNCRVYATTE